MKKYEITYISNGEEHEAIFTTNVWGADKFINVLINNDMSFTLTIKQDTK